MLVSIARFIMKKQNVIRMFQNICKEPLPLTAISTCRIVLPSFKHQCVLTLSLSLTGVLSLSPVTPLLSRRAMACGWSTRWNWPTASRSGRSISLQMSSVRVIRQKERDYGTNRWWHKPTPLSTANKAHWTEQITIMKGRLNELMMIDELRGRDEKKRPE